MPQHPTHTGTSGGTTQHLYTINHAFAGSYFINFVPKKRRATLGPVTASQCEREPFKMSDSGRTSAPHALCPVQEGEANGLNASAEERTC